MARSVIFAVLFVATNLSLILLYPFGIARTSARAASAGAF